MTVSKGCFKTSKQPISEGFSCFFEEPTYYITLLGGIAVVPVCFAEFSRKYLPSGYQDIGGVFLSRMIGPCAAEWNAPAHLIFRKTKEHMVYAA